MGVIGSKRYRNGMRRCDETEPDCWGVDDDGGIYYEPKRKLGGDMIKTIRISKG